MSGRGLVTMEALCRANPFDEREVETGHGLLLKALAIGRASPCYANLNHRATSRLYDYLYKSTDAPGHNWQRSR